MPYFMFGAMHACTWLHVCMHACMHACVQHAHVAIHRNTWLSYGSTCRDNRFPSCVVCVAMAFRSANYPAKGLDWVIDNRTNVVRHARTNRTILCKICKESIVAKKDVVANFTKEDGTPGKLRLDQPVFVHSGNHFVAQHVNCCGEKFFQDEWSHSSSDDE